MKSGYAWIAVGIALGAAAGFAIGNMGATVAVGAALGVAFAALQRARGQNAEGKEEE